jgi:serine/threonine protein kinase
VRLLCYAIDEDPAARHPFVLAFELLEEGSLADHLRGPGGEAPRAAPLTPLERIDAALGAAAGLAHLHGLREAVEPGAAGAAAQAPLLHRDVKSANIGLTRVGGALYAKVLDCGLARALKGGPAGPAGAAPAGRSITGGVVGTLGYMAPELAVGQYTPRSDILRAGVRAAGAAERRARGAAHGARPGGARH